MDYQHTIQKEINFSGVGLHTGNRVKMTFRPGAEESGINFLRTDLPGHPMIKASLEMLLPAVSSPRHTSVGKDGIEIHTIEHLLAVLSGLGIDNLLVEIDNNEIPGLDGSGIEFYEAIRRVGLQEQSRPRQYYRIKEFLSIEEDGATIVAVPSAEFKIAYTLDYDHPLLQTQFLEIEVTPEIFRKELVAARTFCLDSEVEGILEAGLGKGANYENTLVVGKDGIVKNQLRFRDEFVRHKMFDLIGDLYLLGIPIKGHFIAIKSGHSQNLSLLSKIKKQRERYTMAGVSMVDTSAAIGKGELGIEQIKQILPHREPFLFVDQILYLEKGKRAVGLKTLKADDYFFKGHFPGRPIMPGVLIIEAMAQVGGVMMLSLSENLGKLAFFLSCNNVKFRKTVLPGDKLILKVETLKLKARTGIVKAEAYVEDALVAEAELMFTLVER